MTQRIVFTIPGEICTAHRPKFARAGEFVRTYKAAPYAAYLELVTWTGRAALAGIRDWPMNARYAVLITLHEHDARSRDWDNAKAVCDGLQGVLWDNDSQIDDGHVIRGAMRHEAPCVIVEATVLPPGGPWEASKRPKGYRRPSGPLRRL